MRKYSLWNEGTNIPNADIRELLRKIVRLLQMLVPLLVCSSTLGGCMSAEKDDSGPFEDIPESF